MSTYVRLVRAVEASFYFHLYFIGVVSSSNRYISRDNASSFPYLHIAGSISAVEPAGPYTMPGLPFPTLQAAVYYLILLVLCEEFGTPSTHQFLCTGSFPYRS